MKTSILLILISIALSGCGATEHLSDNAKMVREINSDWKNQCHFMGSDQSTFTTGPSSRSTIRLNGKIHMKNKIAEKGGNAYNITEGKFGFGNYTAYYEMYKCKEF